MRNSRKFEVFALIAALAVTRLCTAADLSGDWVGQLTGPFDSQYTAQYNHVALKATGAKLTGTWGSYTFTGTLTGTKADLALTDTGGKLAGTLTGTLADDTLSGTGSVVPARRGGGGGMGAALPPNAVTWKLTCLG